jgi:cold shock CspA family protein
MTKRIPGKITHWNEEKGYGFITPSSGANQVFVHIRAFRNRHLPPELNQVVLYSLSTDKQGRPCAVKVTRAGEKLPGNSKPATGLFQILIAIGFIVVVGWSVSAYNMPIQILYLYLAVSAFTFWFCYRYRLKSVPIGNSQVAKASW